MEVDKAMFKSFDINGDGFVSMQELEKRMKPKTRKKIEEKLDGGWKFNKEAWEASVARHKQYDMKELFAKFDYDGDGKLTIHEFGRAFRALGLPKRDGTKMEMDIQMFKSFDTNGDGFADLNEIDAGLLPKTRRKIEYKLKEGWTFDAETWKKSCERHARWDMSKVFKQFDRDGCASPAARDPTCWRLVMRLSCPLKWLDSRLLPGCSDAKLTIHELSR